MRGLWILLVTTVLAAPAFAACLDSVPGQLPSKITFEDGLVSTVIARTADTIRTRDVVGDYIGDIEVHAGVFILQMEQPFGGWVFTYTSDLPSASQLVPGAHFRAEGTRQAIGGLPDRHIVEVDVVGKETVTIGGCPYPVLEVEVRSSAGVNWTSETLFVHMPSLLTLRTTRMLESSAYVMDTTAIAIE
jgi:hypothetical protein